MAQLVYCLLLLGSLLVGSEIVFGQTSDRIEDAKREGQVVFFSGMIVQDTDRRLSSIPGGHEISRPGLDQAVP
jgi:hypothetical protein